MPILVTVSVHLADSVTLRDLRQFVETAERNGADLDADLREYDENNDLVGLAAVGELESGDVDEEGSDVEDDEGDVDDEEDVEGDVDEDDEGDEEEDDVDDVDDEGDVDEGVAATDTSDRQS
jgi:hypothetical protein